MSFKTNNSEGFVGASQIYLYMATLDQIKEVGRGETDKINLTLDKLTANVKELCKTVKFLNDKYDELLSQVQQTNGKLNQQAKSIEAVKVELDKVKKCATDAMSQCKLKKSSNTCVETVWKFRV